MTTQQQYQLAYAISRTFFKLVDSNKVSKAKEIHSSLKQVDPDIARKAMNSLLSLRNNRTINLF